MVCDNKLCHGDVRVVIHCTLVYCIFVCAASAGLFGIPVIYCIATLGFTMSCV